MKIRFTISLLSLMLTLSCSIDKSESGTTKIKVIAKGEVISNPDVFITYLNVKDVGKNGNQIDCVLYRDSTINALKRLLEENQVKKYKIESSKIKQHNAYNVSRDNIESFVGNYCESAIALSIYDETKSDRVYPELLKNFKVATQEYASSNYDSLNLKAYENALENSKQFASRFLKELNGKSLTIVSISNYEDKGHNKESYGVYEDFPTWTYSGTSLQAVNMLHSSIVKIENKLIVEFEIK